MDTRRKHQYSFHIMPNLFINFMLLNLLSQNMNSTESAYVNMYYYRAENWVETSHIFCPVCFGFVTFCEERVRASIKCFWQMSTERERHFSLAMLMVVAKQIREYTPPPLPSKNSTLSHPALPRRDILQIISCRMEKLKFIKEDHFRKHIEVI